MATLNDILKNTVIQEEIKTIKLRSEVGNTIYPLDDRPYILHRIEKTADAVDSFESNVDFDIEVGGKIVENVERFLLLASAYHTLFIRFYFFKNKEVEYTYREFHYTDDIKETIGNLEVTDGIFTYKDGSVTITN